MNFWVIKSGEPIPLDEGPAQRLLRAGTLARALASRGHKVTWWCSTFQHHTRTHVRDASAMVMLDDGVRLALVRGHGYQRAVSLDRLREHAAVAAGFAAAAPAEEPPDLIISALPMIEACEAAVRYAAPRGIPVVIDVRDLHPDIFQVGLPGPLRPFGRVILAGMRRRTRAACRGAAAVTGITEAFVEWGLAYAGRPRREWDRAFPFGYTAEAPLPAALAEAEAFWDVQGVTADPNVLTAAFVGLVGRSLEVRTILEAAREFGPGAGVRFVIAGDGEMLPQMRADYADCPHVVFPGWLGRAQIHALLRRSTVGLNPMPDRFDFRGTINNKAVEYMSAGLPVIASPDGGVLHDLLRTTGAGVTYGAGQKAEFMRHLQVLRDEPATLAAAAAAASRTYQERFVAENVYGAMSEHLVRLAEDWRTKRRLAPAIGAAP